MKSNSAIDVVPTLVSEVKASRLSSVFGRVRTTSDSGVNTLWVRIVRTSLGSLLIAKVGLMLVMLAALAAGATSKPANRALVVARTPTARRRRAAIFM